VGEISVKTGNNARKGGKNSLNRLIRCVCGKKIGPDPRNFNQRVSLGRNDLLIRTFLSFIYMSFLIFSGAFVTRYLKTKKKLAKLGNGLIGLLFVGFAARLASLH